MDAIVEGMSKQAIGICAFSIDICLQISTADDRQQNINVIDLQCNFDIFVMEYNLFY